jgi:hypothetical protein
MTISNKHVKYAAYSAAALALSALLSVSCAKTIREDHHGARPVKADAPDSEEFKQEGFINGDLFRIVIVTPKEENTPAGEIESAAKRRAFVSLQKYLASKNSIINQNVNAMLLNLVEKDGTLKPLNREHPTRKVYFYEVQRANLRQYVNGLAEKR